MSAIKKIVIPFDFSEASVAALDYGLSFVDFNKPIEILAVYVCPSSFSEHDIEQTNQNFKSIVGELNKKTKFEPHFEMVQGALPDALLQFRASNEVDLIIMGTMGDKSLDEHVTNTSNLVLHAECPVISVPYGSEAQQLNEIALVLGKEEIEDPKILNFLLDVARMFNAKVHVLTIYAESIFDENVVVESNEESLAYYLEHFYVEHNFEKNQDVEQGIFDYIEGKDIDLLAIIPRNHVKKTSPSEGRLTKLLTLHSSVPILTLD